MATVLLAGGEGFIGAHLARALLDDGHAVVSVDAHHDHQRCAPGWRDAQLRRRRETLLDGAELVETDVRDRPALDAVLRRVRPDTVVGLANLPLADVAALDPRRARSGVLDATLALFDAIAAAPRRDGAPPRLVHVSSSMVYGDFTADPQPEDAPSRPRGPYGRMKLAAEQVLRALAPAAGVPLVIARPSAVYGPDDVNGRVLALLVDAAAHGTTFALDCPAATALDFTHVEDLAAGLVLAATHDAAPGATFNLTRGAARTVGAAVAIAQAAAPALHVESVVSRRPAPPRRGALDVTRARERLGYAPHHDLESALPALIAGARELRAVQRVAVAA